MNGLFKGVAITAPVLFLVLYLGWFKVQETSQEVKSESAAFDRDWNEAMSGFSNSKADGKKYAARATAAQTQYSSAQVTLERAAKKNEQIGQEFDRTKSAVDAQDIDRQLDRAERGMK